MWKTVDTGSLYQSPRGSGSRGAVSLIVGTPAAHTSVGLKLSENSIFRLGIDLGGTKIEAALLDPQGEIVFRERSATPQGDYDGTIRAIGELVAGATAGRGVRPTVGVAIPGALSPQSGLVRNANSTWLNGRPFDRDLAAALGTPVRVANDANCFALSEATDGAGAGAGVMFGIIAGTGLGGGIVVQGKLLTGPHAIAGEWGHNPLPSPAASEQPGPRCYCGRHGCLETWLSGPALAADYAAFSGMFKSPPAIAAAALEGEHSAQQAMNRWLDRFARGLGGLINILDPDVIVVGGGLSNIPALYHRLPALIERHVFSDFVRTPLRRAVHGDSSGVRGAAWLWNPERGAPAP